jgi:hypothetical protein
VVYRAWEHSAGVGVGGLKGLMRKSDPMYRIFFCIPLANTSEFPLEVE